MWGGGPGGGLEPPRGFCDSAHLLTFSGLLGSRRCHAEHRLLVAGVWISRPGRSHILASLPGKEWGALGSPAQDTLLLLQARMQWSWGWPWPPGSVCTTVESSPHTWASLPLSRWLCSFRAVASTCSRGYNAPGHPDPAAVCGDGRFVCPGRERPSPFLTPQCRLLSCT